VFELGAHLHARLDLGEQFGPDPVEVHDRSGNDAGNLVVCDVDLPTGRVEGVGSWIVFSFCLLKNL
jgi:hypothetical protein